MVHTKFLGKGLLAPQIVLSPLAFFQDSLELCAEAAESWNGNSVAAIGCKTTVTLCAIEKEKTSPVVTDAQQAPISEM